MRRQIVLDAKSDKLLKQLTADRDGNYSRTVRQALQALADQEAMFESAERDPGFLAMMEQSERDIQAGRYITLQELKKRLHSRKRKAS
jgi:predicted transcriptional regulator